MADAKIDALVVQGASNYAGIGGSYRWLTGVSEPGSYPSTLIFPQDGLSTLVCHGGFDDETTFDETEGIHRGVGRRVTTPSFPSVNYTGTYDAEIIIREINRQGIRTVGLVNPNSMYYGIASRLTGAFGNGWVTDATELIDPIKAAKSCEEIGFIRRTAAVQDEVMSKVHAYIRPGMKEYEISAYAQFVGQTLGSDSGYLLGSSAAKGDMPTLRFRWLQNRTIRPGDVLLFQTETTGPGGYYVHAARYFVLGKAPQDFVQLYGRMLDAQDYTASLLKPGATPSEIFTKYNEYMRSNGFGEEKRLHCHGQGYDSVERPLVRQDETMPIATNMNIGIHPSAHGSSGFITTCDNFLIGSNGAVERLHRTPREIFEI